MKRFKLVLLLLTMALIGFSCGDNKNPTKGGDDHSHHIDSKKDSNEKTQTNDMTKHAKEVLNPSEKNTELTLMDIMRDLAFQINRIEYGIMTNNRYMIAEGASGIVNHPMPKGGLKPYLRKNMDAVKSKIPEMDKNVHQTAKDMIKKAKTASMQELQEMSNKMMSACVSCHQFFRD